MSNEQPDNQTKTSHDEANETVDTTRRAFLGRSAMVAGATAALPVIAATPGTANAAVIPQQRRRRRNAAYEVRASAALEQWTQPLPTHPDNGDAESLTNKIGSFTKGLPHDEYGEVDLRAFRKLRRALKSGNESRFEAIPLGGARKLANPQATYAFSLEGYDSHRTTMPAAPAFSSKDEVAEIVEVYWHALLRDVPFSEYDSHPLVAKAVKDLNKFSYFKKRYSGPVTPANLFRGETPGDLVGPYISQFLLKDVPFGATVLEQRYNVDIAGLDFMTGYDEWLEVQRGNVLSSAVLDATPRRIFDGRSLGSYVHVDFSYQAYLAAAQIITGGLGINPWDPRLPYDFSVTQGRFVTFGGADLLSLIAKVAHEALKAAWFHKWQVHLRLRPETFGGRLHHHLSGTRSYPIHRSVNKVGVFDETYSRTGSYLLPMAYVEGSPTHPAYPAGHATIAGACTTIMKALFDEEHPVPDAIAPDSDGVGVSAYTGDVLTIGGELNKLASNIALGRDIAGVHWRTDGTEGLLVGEQVAIGVLRDIKRVYNESFDGFSFRGFEGNQVTV
ncbi:MAG: vanadium-dependent haloperoxidase [Pseudomonadota bacterium]